MRPTLVGSGEWQAVATELGRRCAEVGLDVTHPFNVRLYQAQALEHERLASLQRPDALGVLVGNTARLWPAFRRALETDAALGAEQHPLDTFVETRLSELVQRATKRATQLVFSHVTKPRPFPIQRLAELVGLAAVAPCQLSIHPEYGPWFALRAVVVVDLPGPEAPPPELARPCRGCSAPCLPALKSALAVSGTPLTSQAIAEHAADWIAVRDACPVGRGFRYGDDQLAYHYRKALQP